LVEKTSVSSGVSRSHVFSIKKIVAKKPGFFSNVTDSVTTGKIRVSFPIIFFPLHFIPKALKTMSVLFQAHAETPDVPPRRTDSQKHLAAALRDS